MVDIIFWAATLLGLVPLYWYWRNRPVGVEWWWMAVAFGVSFLADMVGRFVSAPFVSQVYPVLQAAIFALVLLSRRNSEAVIAVLLASAGSSIVIRGGQGLDVLLHTIAWGTVALVAWQTVEQRALRVALGWGFAGLVLGWWWYVADPGWTSWLWFQSARALGIGWWCVACSRREA